MLHGSSKGKISKEKRLISKSSLRGLRRFFPTFNRNNFINRQRVSLSQDISWNWISCMVSELEEKFIEVFSQPSMRKNKNC